MRKSRARKIVIGILILCGGKGTRIKTELGGKPKILAKIGNKLGLDYILEWVNMFEGSKDIYLCTGYLSRQIENHVKTNKTRGVKILKENEPRGTLYTIDNAIRSLNNDYYLIINGDTLVEVNLSDVINEAKKRRSEMMLTLVRSEKKQYGVQGGKVKEYNKLGGEESYISTGILWVKKKRWIMLGTEYNK